MKNKLLTYAIKDKELVNISSVESGIACECICPSCGEKLIAKKGKIKVHHFAHQGNGECQYGYQTAIHLAAKEIIARNLQLRLPKLEIATEEFDLYASGIVQEEMNITINSVILERKLDDIIPDILLNTNIGSIIVEVFVTHKVDEEKKKKIEKLGIPTIEIDLSEYDYIEDKDLEQILLNITDNKRWIYNPKVLEAINDLKSVSEYKRIIPRGYTLHVDGCPIRCREWNGKSYANVIDDCQECDYCIGQTEGSVICAGKKRVASYEDLFISDQKRIELANKKMEKEKQDRLAKGRCLYCSGSLKLRERKRDGEKFWGCSNYPHCRFAIDFERYQPADEMKDVEKVANLQYGKRNAPSKEELKSEIIDQINQQITLVKDSRGNRWIKCEYCGNVDTEGEFVTYGGMNHINLGRCKKCDNQMG